MVRTAFIIIFALLIATLLICGLASWRSEKPIGKAVCLLCISLIPPVLGNMIIIAATTKAVAYVGCYIYYIGMDFVMFALIRFTDKYCRYQVGTRRKKYSVPIWINHLLGLDVLQLLLNIAFGHAFVLSEIEAYGKPYFIMTPLLGQTFHRIICYGAMALTIIVFIIKSIQVPRLYKERYIVILISMIIGTMWQTFYIFSRTPIDRSMVGFAVFGLLIYYFSMHYRPLRLLDNMLADIINDTSVAVLLYGPEGRCIWANEPAKELTGRKSDEPEGISAALESLFGEIKSLPDDQDTEITRGIADSEKSYMIARGGFKDRSGKDLGSYVRVRDITQEKKRIEAEMYAANHDALTGLYNKEYTYKKINDQLKLHTLDNFYIATIHLCDFKVFNDVFGHEFGDAALKQVADWMSKYSDDNCIYGRIAGDRFGSCLPKNMMVEELLESDLAHFTVKLGDIEQNLTVHLGFCDVDEDVQDAAVLFDRAYIALDSIKDDYRRHVAFFDKKIRDKMIWNQEISAQLDNAIAQNQIIPYLQPIADNSGKIVGAEALVRWIHPVNGFMSPGDFIPLFEENGMIAELDKHIWRSACKILSSWEKKYPGIFISVNVSPKDFYMTDVYGEITSYVQEYGINPHNLRIEVTESSMMRDTDDRMKVLEDFRNDGFIVEMDDFGSGYSSLNMLKDMPVDVLKIDMKFLGKSNDEQKANIIVKNVIRLSEDLCIVSLAEGVETAENFDQLNGLGCDLFQGYYFSKPVPQADFEAMLDKERGNA
ncbi:EAL domain-containing protein [Butyrivibrio sp. CB08]|uniref:EAL domain-containing protein n=1 Tax=Butyrivibrio sp. CB08 TaxID=2364879 RepID=UPI000EAAA0F2|nr:EAL domain-containing protein [Butyrivibrio sp. CB08]RKM55365.1 EAL domain-containing protein [Butyrivibrio sp. CB08]